MNEFDVINFTKSLQGITFNDWIKVKIAVDFYFEKRYREFQSKIKLSEIEELPECVKSTTHLQSE